MAKRNRHKQNRSVDGTTDLLVASDGASDQQPESHSAEDDRCASGMDETAYVGERTLLVEMEQKSADQHDKAILTVASGGLALSITFLKDIAPNPLPETWKYLGVSWACFVVGILAILLSFLTSQSACRKQRDFLDELYQKGSVAVAAKKNWWSSWTNGLNWVSYALVFFAVVFFTLFSWLNLGKGGHETMTDTPQNQQVQSSMKPIEVKGGAVPPKPPVAPTMERKTVPTGSGGKGGKK
jgi:hypothetical protein